MKQQSRYQLPQDLISMIRDISGRIAQLEKERSALLTGWMTGQEMDKAKQYELTADQTALIEVDGKN